MPADVSAIAAAVSRFIRAQAAGFQAALRKARRRGDARAVHDLRVASRRLAEPLRLASAWVGGEAEKLRRRLRRARRAYRRVRDLDVMIGLATRAPAAKDPQVRRAVEDAVRRWRSERRTALERAAEKTDDGASTARRLLRLADQLERADDVGADWSAATVELVRRRAVELSRLATADADGRADPHALRIAAKRLRYAMEFAEQTGVGGYGACIRRLRRMQEALGDWHDRFVLAEELAVGGGSTESSSVGRSAALLKAAADWMKAADRELVGARRHRRGVQEALTGHVPQTRSRIEERNAGRGTENGRQRVGRGGGVRTGAG